MCDVSVQTLPLCIVCNAVLAIAKASVRPSAVLSTMSIRFHHAVTTSTGMSLRPDHALAMTIWCVTSKLCLFVLRLYYAQHARTPPLSRSHYVYTTLRLRTVDSQYKFEYYHGTTRVMDEATQLHVMLLVQHVT